MRKLKLIDINEELKLINKVANELLEDGYNASNSLIVTVSTDYSSILGQILRHKLSHKGEVVDGFGIDVPYGDEMWDDKHHTTMLNDFKNHAETIYGKNIILVQTVVISKTNYQHVVDSIYKWLGINNNIITVTLFENISSEWESNYVGKYYDVEFEDLVFWWENNHW